MAQQQTYITVPQGFGGQGTAGGSYPMQPTYINQAPGAAAGGGTSTITRSMGGGSSSVGPTPINMQSLIERFTKQQDAANAANETRYQQLLGIYGKMGTAATKRNNNMTRVEQAAAASSLTNRGLGNSTIVDSVRQGIGRQGLDRQDQIAEQVAGNLAGVIERRTDQAPDMSLLAQLLMRPGAIR